MDGMDIPSRRVVCQGNLRCKGSLHSKLPRLMFSGPLYSALLAVTTGEEGLTVFWMHLGPNIEIELTSQSSMFPNLKQHATLDTGKGGMIKLGKGNKSVHLDLSGDEASYQQWYRGLREALVETIFRDALSVRSPEGSLSVSAVEQAICEASELVPQANCHVLRAKRALENQDRIHQFTKRIKVKPYLVSKEQVDQFLREADNDPIFSHNGELKFLRSLLPRLFTEKEIKESNNKAVPDRSSTRVLKDAHKILQTPATEISPSLLQTIECQEKFKFRHAPSSTPPKIYQAFRKSSNRISNQMYMSEDSPTPTVLKLADCLTPATLKNPEKICSQEITVTNVQEIDKSTIDKENISIRSNSVCSVEPQSFTEKKKYSTYNAKTRNSPKHPNHVHDSNVSPLTAAEVSTIGNSKLNHSDGSQVAPDSSEDLCRQENKACTPLKMPMLEQSKKTEYENSHHNSSDKITFSSYFRTIKLFYFVLVLPLLLIGLIYQSDQALKGVAQISQNICLTDAKLMGMLCTSLSRKNRRSDMILDLYLKPKYPSESKILRFSTPVSYMTKDINGSEVLPSNVTADSREFIEFSYEESSDQIDNRKKQRDDFLDIVLYSAID